MEIPYSADQIESESESESENGSIDMDFGWRVDHAIMSESGSNLGASPVHSFTSILDNAIRSEAVSIFGSSPVPSFVSAEDNVMTSLFSSAHVNNFSLHNSTANRGNSNTGGRGFAARLFALANWRRRKPLAAACKRFSLRELQRATDNFSYKNFLGSGGFGKVYKGRLADGSLVAVKRLKQQPKQGDDQQFQTEVAIISMIVHRNLLPLRGFCIARNERLLVYPFMVNGSVLSCLRERQESQRPLGWPDRKSIALGSAKGLAYLHDHCEPKIIHRDVKAANIYLDDELEAVVGDFGLAILMNPNDTHVTTVVRGTLGHIAPEYLLTGRCSEKSDVFGYGMMLLELISGQRDFYVARLAKDGNVMLLNWVKGLLKDKKLETLVDADLQGNCNEEEVEKLIQLALLCTQYSPTERPKMSEVVIMLNGIGLAEKWEQYLQKDKIFWLSEIAEQAKRRAEIARLRDLHTLKGHVDSVVKLKGFDIDTIQQHYTV